MDSLPITVADVGQVLELNPSDYHITKTKIDFDSPKKVTLRYASASNSRDWKIPGKSSSVIFLTYVPKSGGPIKPLKFWIAGSQGATHSAFPFDTSKVKFTKSEIINGIFTVRASKTEDFSDPEYKIQILTE